VSKLGTPFAGARWHAFCWWHALLGEVARLLLGEVARLAGRAL
jgi:hypothetical protein